MSEGDDAYYAILGDPQAELPGLTDDELAAIALGDDQWLNAPALSELGYRSSELAVPTALRALERPDHLLVAAAVRTLGTLDLDELLAYVERSAPDWPESVLDAIVEVLAVDHPIPRERAAELLDQIASRLEKPQNSRQFNVAQLFFNRYPRQRDDPPQQGC
jgi:hypothetical protein